MSAYVRLALVLLAVFVTIYVVGAVFYLQQARADIAREQRSAEQVARVIPAPGALAGGLVAGLRHLRPAVEPPAPRQSGVRGLFTLAVTGAEPGTAVVINGWRADPSDEVEEIWENFLLISLAYGTGMGLCFLALFVAVRRGTAPLNTLATAMDTLAHGQLSARLPPQSISELDRLVERFNDMAAALEAEQQTVSRLLNELLQLRDNERAHIARILHDDLGQYLTGIRALAQGWVYDPTLNPSQIAQARLLAEHCETVQGHFRLLLQDLHPLVMEQLGLVSGVQHLVERWQRLSGVRCQLSVDQDLPELTGEAQTNLYRWLQESLNNVSRHANATLAKLTLMTGHDGLRLQVTDNGCGFCQASVSPGLGLRSMRERARTLGATMEIRSDVGQGTRIDLTVPL
ncbi:sensor histidine kinase [Marinobacter zhejiangensis]|uniref:histidine kinase n=1 Tax=Marinobacter zhejiangensis TaxID=488535 RepID=A0A1I4SGF8_9GAMM|nr:HAMP domain-containing sensor histidine kinase [Marinobacter zhejiangensis]SFM63557.1 two-component system, NarL family, sensor histidine kinase UhpB [Marinobacter zhejiangensis]